MSETGSRTRLGILWRGLRDDGPSAPDPSHGLGPLFEALEELPVTVVPVPYEDDSVSDVRTELLSLDGVLVWVNPIQDGVNRERLDTLLRDVSLLGIWVSAHPDVIMKIGTKEVLYRTRGVGWGSENDLYRTPEDFMQRFPAALAKADRLVVKQARGNGGNGVWKVELRDRVATVSTETTVRLQDARAKDGSSDVTTLGAFMDRCVGYFAWSGCLVAQRFEERLDEGMLRCYLSHDEVVGFCHQWPKGLLDFDPDDARIATTRVPTVMEGPDTPEYRGLRSQLEREWLPRMMETLDMARESLPVIWDADFLYGAKTGSGDDTYVLCEINCSAVWPFPPMGAQRVAAAALERTKASKALCL